MTAVTAAFREIRARIAAEDVPIHVAADIEQIICETGGDFGDEALIPPACEHDFRNRERGGYRTGLGAACVKCGEQLEHDFDPRADRGHPVGKTCARCGATEWQYVDGVLCHVDWNHR